uniref:Dihydrolipoyllysine-residue succinyltransferase component of 2-oxoglutarate dehydrogenase complex, mitochondrial n=1 Tax=Scylla olivacea TaxID=85551 RepID=A0A0P4W6Q9_SCYOL
MELRKSIGEQFVKKHGIKLGFMSAFVKASAYALTQQPTVNAVIDGSEIVYRDYVDISVAVATPKVTLYWTVITYKAVKNILWTYEGIGIYNFVKYVHISI